MGQSDSKPSHSPESDLKNASSSPINRLKQRVRSRIHRHRRSGASNHHRAGSSNSRPLGPDDFAGIALVTLIQAEMKFKDKWFACLSFGEQTFKTDVSDQTDKPVWNSEKKLLLETNGPHVARVSVFETNRLSKNNLVGYREIDLLEFLARESDSNFEIFELSDPSNPDKIVGNIYLSCSVEDPIETEKGFARRILSIVVRVTHSIIDQYQSLYNNLTVRTTTDLIDQYRSLYINLDEIEHLNL